MKFVLLVCAFLLIAIDAVNGHGECSAKEYDHCARFAIMCDSPKWIMECTKPKEHIICVKSREQCNHEEYQSCEIYTQMCEFPKFIIECTIRNNVPVCVCKDPYPTEPRDDQPIWARSQGRFLNNGNY
ncbi:hypothetical protein TSAR_003310 [Trichomalopsis sarcophagae]|uniref:Uncharacterized protein n=1 Tax=Trichomalopsis sarcophagae TaxID=543379 RepID=A0A232F5Q9_9HYME|nr:hypothetical protein TSAR_003310 [Trichomalopsis sarcophagae]